jgi:type VI protein secretion system component VasK
MIPISITGVLVTFALLVLAIISWSEKRKEMREAKAATEAALVQDDAFAVQVLDEHQHQQHQELERNSEERLATPLPDCEGLPVEARDMC